MKRRPAGRPRERHVRVPRVDSRARWPPTRRTASSCGPSSRSSGDERKGPPTVWYKEIDKPENSSWTTWARCSSASGSRAPTATTTRTRSGARTTTGGWRRSSAASAGKEVRVPAAGAEPGQPHVQVIYVRATGNAEQQADAATRRCRSRSTPRPDGHAFRGRRPAAEAGGLDGRPEEPVLRQDGGEPVLGTSSAAASSIRSTTCGSPTRRSNPELLDALAAEPGREQVQPEGAGQDDLQEPHVPAGEHAERVQQARQAGLRPVLPEAAASGSAAGRGWAR